MPSRCHRLAVPTAPLLEEKRNVVPFALIADRSRLLRNEAVRPRCQVDNPKTGLWAKRNAGSGRFMNGKADGKPFKGVRKEK